MRLFFSLLLFSLGFAAAAVVRSEAITSDFANASKDGGMVDQDWFQVRIEQRVIISIPRQRTSLVSNGKVQNQNAKISYNEQKIGKCLVMNRIVGSRLGDKDTLELVTRDGVLIRAYLGDGCLAREFYAGAYMERSADGMLCIDRDLLYARTGAKCEVDKFRQLLAK